MKEGHEDALEMDWSEKAGRQWATELAAWSCGITVTAQRMTGTRMLEIVISTWCSDGAEPGSGG